MRIVISGGSGTIGTALRQRLIAQGDTVIQLVRRPATSGAEAHWDPAAGALSPDVLRGADAVVNLSGATLSRLPWTPSYRRTILQSRRSATATIVGALRRLAAAGEPVPDLVSGSAVGFYGNRPSVELDETAARGKGFLAEVVDQWEHEALQAADVTRVVLARTGLVIGDGGAGRVLRRIAWFGLAGPIGNGRQHWPWVSLRDEVAALDHLLRSDLTGPVNLVGPTPATAGAVMRELARQLRRPYWAPLPAPLITMVLRDAARDLLLADQRVVPTRLQRDGFEFADRTIADAIRSGLAVPR